MEVATIIARAHREAGAEQIYVSHGHVLRVFEECSRGLVEMSKAHGYWQKLSAFRFELFKTPVGEIFVEIVDE